MNGGGLEATRTLLSSPPWKQMSSSSSSSDRNGEAGLKSRRDRQMKKIRAKYRAMVSLLSAAEQEEHSSRADDLSRCRALNNKIHQDAVFVNLTPESLEEEEEEEEEIPWSDSSDATVTPPLSPPSTISLEFLPPLDNESEELRLLNIKKRSDQHRDDVGNYRKTLANGRHRSTPTNVATSRETLFTNGGHRKSHAKTNGVDGASALPAPSAAAAATAAACPGRSQSLTEGGVGVSYRRFSSSPSSSCSSSSSDGEILRRLSDSCVHRQIHRTTSASASASDNSNAKTVSVGVNTDITVREDGCHLSAAAAAAAAARATTDGGGGGERRVTTMMTTWPESDSSAGRRSMCSVDLTRRPGADPEDLESAAVDVVHPDCVLLGVLDPDAEEEEAPIVSSKGTVRGMRNRVKVGIAVFDENQGNGSVCKNYRLLERGKVVLYTTSVMVIRETHERCLAMKKILENHMIEFDERDVFLCRDFQRELMQRLGQEHFDLPQIFVSGFNLGGPDEIDRLNETGILRKMFKNVKKVTRPSVCCVGCGGYNYVPCPNCRGSKKSSRINNFTQQLQALRCTSCDDNGLVRCNRCTKTQHHHHHQQHQQAS